MKTLICCIGKNENRYIKEFVDYHRKIGVTNICLFDNNDKDGEHFEAIIKEDIDSGFVLLKDYRGRKVCQMQAYQECYDTYKNQYDWIMFMDCDEFIYLVEDSNISQYLSRDIFNEFGMIHLNIMHYGDCDKAHYEDKPVQERFDHPLPLDTKIEYPFPENDHISSIIRGGLSDVHWEGTPHTTFPCNINCCNNIGIPCRPESPFVHPYNFDLAYFKHYNNKTIEEYCDKIKRGFADQIVGDKKKLALIQHFFAVNKITLEKFNIVKEKLGLKLIL